MDFRDNCGIIYIPRIIETVKTVQVQFYPDFLQNTSFLLSLDKLKQSESSPSWRQIRICLFLLFIIKEIWFYKLFSQKHSSYSLNDNSSINSNISNPNSLLYILRKSMDAL